MWRLDALVDLDLGHVPDDGAGHDGAEVEVLGDDVAVDGADGVGFDVVAAVPSLVR